MVRSSTYKDEQYNIYELHVESAHAVTAGEAGTPGAIVIADVQAHAVVIANKEYARGYANGALTAITGVTFAADDTTVAFTSLTQGDIIDIYFPVTGTACGNLESNINVGKLTLPRMQNIQQWNVSTNLTQVPECGTDRKEPVEFAADGMITLGLNRHGNDAMADFIAAREGIRDRIAAQGTITMAGVAQADETFVIDTQTYTWKAARSTTGEVTIGATAAAAVTNIITAITADQTMVTAADGAGDTVVVSAAARGTIGNTIVFTKNSTNMTVDGTGTLGTTTAGDDGSAGEIYLLIDVEDTTVALSTHDLLLEAKVVSYARMARAVDSIGGIVTDTVTCSFVPDVVTFDET
jgi:hypothetical protein